MNIQRFSAAPMFGAPVENQEQLTNLSDIMALMSAYNIEGQDVPVGITDITPPYLQKTTAKYFTTREHANGLVEVHIMPRFENTEFKTVNPQGEIVPDNARTFTIPTEIGAMPLVCESPRFAGKLCLHELIVDIDLL